MGGNKGDGKWAGGKGGDGGKWGGGGWGQKGSWHNQHAGKWGKGPGKWQQEPSAEDGPETKRPRIIEPSFIQQQQQQSGGKDWWQESHQRSEEAPGSKGAGNGKDQEEPRDAWRQAPLPVGKGKDAAAAGAGSVPPFAAKGGGKGGAGGDAPTAPAPEFFAPKASAKGGDFAKGGDLQEKGKGKPMDGAGKSMSAPPPPQPPQPAPGPLNSATGPSAMAQATMKAMGAPAPGGVAQPPQAASACPPLQPQEAGPKLVRRVLLAPAVAHITPQSSRSSAAPPPGIVAPPAPVTGAGAMAAAAAGSASGEGNKQIAMQFVNASKEVQAQMLKDPAVARAILQTLAENPSGQSGGGGGLPPQLAGMMGGCSGTQVPPPFPGPAPQLPPPPMMSPHGVPMGIMPPPLPGMPSAVPAAPPQMMPPPAPPAWTGVVTLARNMGKRLPLRAALLQGKVSDVEVLLRSAAGNSSVIDITHRVPFDEVARKVASGSILTLVPNTIMEQASFEEYGKYFRTKQRAGVAKLEGSLSLYVLPSAEDFPVLRDSLYALGPHVPRAGCLIGIIGPGTAATSGGGAAAPAATAAPVGTATASKAAAEESAPAVKAEPATEQAAEKPAAAAAAPAEDAASGAAAEAAGEDGEGGMSSNELMDLFSNPDLIRLLSSGQAEKDA